MSTPSTFKIKNLVGSWVFSDMHLKNLHIHSSVTSQDSDKSEVDSLTQGKTTLSVSWVNFKKSSLIDATAFHTSMQANTHISHLTFTFLFRFCLKPECNLSGKESFLTKIGADYLVFVFYGFLLSVKYADLIQPCAKCSKR